MSLRDAGRSAICSGDVQVQVLRGAGNSRSRGSGVGRRRTGFNAVTGSRTARGELPSNEGNASRCLPVEGVRL